jgi:hypothetical protein
VLLPVLDTLVPAGDSWQGVPNFYSDDLYYYARLHEISDGHPFLGNPYYYEHRNDPAPAFFVADWIAWIPMGLGASLPVALVINFSIWFFIFLLLVYSIFIKIGLSRYFAIAGSVFVAVQSYEWLLRTVSMEIVLPVFALFLLSFLCWAKDPKDRRPLFALVVASALSFYVYTYLWQIVVVALFVYVLLKWRTWDKDERDASVMGILLTILLALPSLIYTYLQLQNPYFWESMQRIGLVFTHLPAAEAL